MRIQISRDCSGLGPLVRAAVPSRLAKPGANIIPYSSRLFTPHRFKVHPRQASLDGDRYCALPSRLNSENLFLEYLSGLLSVRMVAYIGALSGTYARRQQNGRKFSNCDPRRQYVNPLVVWRLAI